MQCSALRLRRSQVLSLVSQGGPTQHTLQLLWVASLNSNLASSLAIMRSFHEMYSLPEKM